MSFNQGNVQNDKLISPEKFLEIINTGEWAISHGRLMSSNSGFPGVASGTQIIRTVVNSGGIVIEYEKSADRLDRASINLLEGEIFIEAHSDRIRIMQRGTVPQQISKAEGGGIRHVPHLFTMLHLVHYPTWTARNKERREREDSERRQREEMQRRHQNEDRRRREREQADEAARKEAYVASLKTSVTGARLTSLSADDAGNLVLKFDNGFEMEIVPHDQEQYYAWLSINGVRLDSGMPESE